MTETEYSEADRRRIEKHKVLQKFDKVKKSYFKAVLLCCFLGFVGAHRLYLEQRVAAAIIILIWAALSAGIYFASDKTNMGVLIATLVSGGAIIAVELFRITKTTDAKNHEIQQK